MNEEDFYERELSFEDLEAISGGLGDAQMKHIRDYIHDTKRKLAKGQLPHLQGLTMEQMLDRWRWKPEVRAYAEQIWDEA